MRAEAPALSGRRHWTPGTSRGLAVQVGLSYDPRASVFVTRRGMARGGATLGLDAWPPADRGASAGSTLHLIQGSLCHLTPTRPARTASRGPAGACGAERGSRSAATAVVGDLRPAFGRAGGARRGAEVRRVAGPPADWRGVASCVALRPPPLSSPPGPPSQRPARQHRGQRRLRGCKRHLSFRPRPLLPPQVGPIHFESRPAQTFMSLAVIISPACFQGRPANRFLSWVRCGVWAGWQEGIRRGGV